MSRLISAGAAAALLAACSITAPDGGERLGSIHLGADGSPHVTVPQSAQRGVPFDVMVVTVGGGCVNQGPTRTRTRGMTAEVRPYDVHNGSTVCTADVRLYEHTATLYFDTPGTATVRFVGAGEPGKGPITVDRTVTIR